MAHCTKAEYSYQKRGILQVSNHRRKLHQVNNSKNKTRMSKVGAISKAQEAQNIIFEKTNIHSVAKYQISKKLKGDPLEEKIQKSLKVSQCRKTERDPLRFFNIHSVAKHEKNAGGPFGEKFPKKNVSHCRKKLKGGTIWCCPVWYVTRKNRENLFGPVR